MFDNIRRNRNSADKRRYKTINWNVHVNEYERVFLEASEWAKKHKVFDCLYVSKECNEKQIQLSTGTQPIGDVRIKTNERGRVIGRELTPEYGATLVISQSALGNVAIILYPCSSNKLKQKEDYIIWGIFDDPSMITSAILTSALKCFFCYIRVSSSLFSESFLDRLTVRYAYFKGQKYIAGLKFAKVIFSGWVGVIGVAGSLSSIYAILK